MTCNSFATGGTGTFQVAEEKCWETRVLSLREWIYRLGDDGVSVGRKDQWWLPVAESLCVSI